MNLDDLKWDGSQHYTISEAIEIEEQIQARQRQQQAQEAEIENKTALVNEFVQTCARMVDLIDELDAEGIVTDLDALRDMISVAKYPFQPDFDDHSLEDLS